MERDDRPVVSFFWPESFGAGDRVELRGDPAWHARARRARAGDRARLLDGRGRVAFGEIASVGKSYVTVAVDRVVESPKPLGLEVLAPIADRDRMLWAAEKCVELQVTAWRPVWFARSRSVTPRGEGPKFREKVEARMRAALEQSGGAWMPELLAEMEGEDALRSCGEGCTKVLLEARGTALPPLISNDPTVLAVGPEGGFERQEIAAARDCGWMSASLGSSTLRFETALVAGAAVVRAIQLSQRGSRG